MSSSESTETLIRNPKESAVIFGCVVILAVVLEFAFSYFRNHRSSYISGLFGQLSEETMIVGCISLIFVFVVQSFPNLPDSWVVIFRWAQGVIFFMIVFFVVGVAWTAVISRILCVMIQKFEFRLLEALTRRQILSMGSRCYLLYDRFFRCRRSVDCCHLSHTLRDDSEI
ncbi:membrane-associated protein, putative [Bodo saltans]|uniref:Membrane-associated protein, putative n=1 Tax=Bodo saltans TaxID=75058 RepID=A0A0S4J7D4_BODSA|nr:membrane-associated protein, putative [Bodo saltans]|eukprot:CUG86203.1 membrane-associated protein, putative [Bodo saltans]